MKVTHSASKPAAISRRRLPSTAARRCRRKFLHFFPGGFRDETYLAWERDYKWRAHQQWMSEAALSARRVESNSTEIANHAVRIESRTNLLFSFEKMALRDGVRSPAGARIFAQALHDFLHGTGSIQERFERWCEALGNLPRKQTRVLTWPVATVFPFLARPEKHIFLKPNVTRRAAEEYEFEFEYSSRPNWETYASLLRFAQTVRADLRDLRPRDMIDIQSFLWVQGSDEYEE